MTFDNEYLNERFEDIQSQIKPNTYYKLVLSNCINSSSFIFNKGLKDFTIDKIIHCILHNHYDALKIIDSLVFKNEPYIEYKKLDYSERDDESSFIHVFLYKV